MAIQKIISGGEDGTEQAALDAAIRIGIDHGGFAAVGPSGLNGRIKSRYRLKSTPGPDQRSQVASNILVSDGVLILSRGVLSAGAQLAAQFAEIYHRPCLLVDLHYRSLTDASRMIASWIKINKLRCLCVTGSSLLEDPASYADTYHLLLRVFRLTEIIRKGMRSADSDFTSKQESQEVIEEIIAELPIKERFAIANMDKVDVQAVQRLFDRYVRKDDMPGMGDDESADLIERLWKRLKATHTLRRVK